MKYIAVLGYGTVGSGVAEVFARNHESIVRKADDDMAIKYILEIREIPQDDPCRDKITDDFSRIADDPEVSLVAEVMGGLHPAYEYVKTCLERGKSVVTSNKELVAQKGAELLRIAKENGVNFFFEASVGGGIPIIRPLHSCLAANEITEVAGILNGTTNFILTKMFRDNMGFSDALALAQELGYAERDPSADVEGLDACRKICILASLAFGRHVYPSQVPTQGITALTALDVACAEAAGCVIKLIGRARKLPSGKLILAVAPAFIGEESQLASISDVFNGVLVRGNATGDVVFYGKGAGKLPTASAVIGDLIYASKLHETVSTQHWADGGEGLVEDAGKDVNSWFLRLETGPLHDARYHIEGVFPQVHWLSCDALPKGQEALLTKPIAGEALERGLSALRGLGIQVHSSICMLDY